MKEQPVVLKGLTNAISIKLDEGMEYSELRKIIIEKFSETAQFYKDAKVAITFEGKHLTDAQQTDVLQIIDEYTDINVICILGKDAVKEKEYEKEINEKLMSLSSSTGQFYKGNLRSGQSLEMDTSVIIIGDVNPGASVMSKGNIIVLGSLRGNAFAGAAGNDKAFVLALDMSPVQIRIADTIARAPDKQDRDEIKETRIAFCENGNIYIETLSKQVLNDIQI